ncbi:MAG: GIY-YIG nuclease family protein [Lentisphaerae bacterium]|nr:GIY-YIG nuclease family protein [Lentisphaerota bacterium]
MAFAYTYVLLCGDGEWYIGSTPDMRRRMREHEAGQVSATSTRRPLKLVYYEACRSLGAAREREKQLKTGYGRGYLNKRLAFEKACYLSS